VTLLLVALKSVLVLSGALLVVRRRRFTAAHRHLVLVLAMASLPLMLVCGLLGASMFSIDAPGAIGDWAGPVEVPETELAAGSSSQAAAGLWSVQPGPAAWYAGVSAVLMAYWLLQLIRTSRWITRNTQPHGQGLGAPGRKRQVTLRRADRDMSPITWGIVKPVVVVPDGWARWPAERRHAVLAHEMAHVRRWDTLVSTMSVVISCLFWANPLVWVVHRRLLAEAEQACDDAVVSQGVPATKYASELLAVARSRVLPLAHAAAAQSTLSRRIRALADPGTRRMRMNTRQLLGTLAMAIALVVPLATLDARASAELIGDRRVPSMSHAVRAALSQVQSLIDAEEFDQALKTAEPLLTNDLNPNETAQIHNMLGFIYFSKDNHERALDHYLQVLAQGEAIPEGLELQTYYTAAQLSFILERYQEAIHYIRSWQQIADAGTTAVDPHIFIGQVYYQLNEYQRAIQAINTGIELAEATGTTIKENWWALLGYLYYEEGQFQDYIEVLERLRRDYPDEKYDRRLEGIKAMVG
jgi:tetratricopeptide (TPR) repeat protein